MALEGALKLKEISYIHAEGYAAGEMKHGFIAMIDELSHSLATKDMMYDKVISNMQEIKSRSGKIIAIATEGDEEIAKIADDVIYTPPISISCSPFPPSWRCSSLPTTVPSSVVVTSINHGISPSL